MSPLDFVIIGLATWRLAYMLVAEDGPWSVFSKIRSAFGKLFAGLFDCVYCMSIWTGVLCVLLWWIGAGILLVPFAASALGLAIASFTGVGQNGEEY